MRGYIIRFVLGMIALVSVFVLPWWVPIGIGSFLIVRYGAYEMVFVGLTLDALTSAQVPAWWDVEFVFTLYFLVLSLVFYYVRPHLLNYDTKT